MKQFLQVVLYSLLATLVTASVLGVLPLWVILPGCGIERVTFYEFIRTPKSDWYSGANNDTTTLTALLCSLGVFVLALIAFAILQKTNPASDSTPAG